MARKSKLSLERLRVLPPTPPRRRPSLMMAKRASQPVSAGCRSPQPQAWTCAERRPVLEQRDRGQNVVEFALVAGIFFLLLAGLFDVGRAVWYYSTLQEGVRQAARYAVVHGSNSQSPIGPANASALTAVVEKYTGPTLSSSDLTVRTAYPEGTDQPGSRVIVTGSYPFKPFMGFGLASFTISASTTREIVN